MPFKPGNKWRFQPGNKWRFETGHPGGTGGSRSGAGKGRWLAECYKRGWPDADWQDLRDFLLWKQRRKKRQENQEWKKFKEKCQKSGGALPSSENPLCQPFPEKKPLPPGALDRSGFWDTPPSPQPRTWQVNADGFDYGGF